MKKRIFSAIVATIAALSALILVPFYQTFGIIIVILATVAMGALQFI